MIYVLVATMFIFWPGALPSAPEAVPFPTHEFSGPGALEYCNNARLRLNSTFSAGILQIRAECREAPRYKSH